MIQTDPVFFLAFSIIFAKIPGDSFATFFADILFDEFRRLRLVDINP